MNKIETKRMPNGKWSCFATIEGYDYAFVTDSKEDSQRQMTDLLVKKNLLHRSVFLEAVVYPLIQRIKKEVSMWIRPRLDFL